MFPGGARRSAPAADFNGLQEDFPMTHPVYHNLIGGQWLPAAEGKTILNLNPADHTDVVGAFPSSHADDVAAAVAAAKKAFASWRLVPAPKRAEIVGGRAT